MKALREAERQLIIEALSHSQSGVAGAAQRLGISRTSMYRKMHEHGIVSDRRQQSIKFVPIMGKS